MSGRVHAAERSAGDAWKRNDYELITPGPSRRRGIYHRQTFRPRRRVRNI